MRLVLVVSALAIGLVPSAMAEHAITPAITVDYTVRATDHAATLVGSGRVVLSLRGSKLVTTAATGRVTVDVRGLFKSQIELTPLLAKTFVSKVGGAVELKVTRSKDSDCPLGRTAVLELGPQKGNLSTVILHPFKGCSLYNRLWTNSLDGATVRIVIHTRVG